MKTLGNIIWHVFFLGFISAFVHFLIGLIITATVVGAPVGLGIIQYSKFLLAPFTQAMVSKDELGQKQNKAWKVFSVIVWILYLPLGIALFLYTIAEIVVLFVSLIGIPAGLVLAKSLNTYFKPINKKCVPLTVKEQFEREKYKK
jgi:uncharacterized membrane protein YccF (DUF307 family)